MYKFTTQNYCIIFNDRCYQKRPILHLHLFTDMWNVVYDVEV